MANSRAITPTSFKGSGWLLNLAEIFCQQTFSQMIIQWNYWSYWADKCSGNPSARRTCFHNTSHFFKRRIKMRHFCCCLKMHVHLYYNRFFKYHSWKYKNLAEMFCWNETLDFICYFLLRHSHLFSDLGLWLIGQLLKNDI